MIEGTLFVDVPMTTENYNTSGRPAIERLYKGGHCFHIPMPIFGI